MFRGSLADGEQFTTFSEAIEPEFNGVGTTVESAAERQFEIPLGAMLRGAGWFHDPRLLVPGDYDVKLLFHVNVDDNYQRAVEAAAAAGLVSQSVVLRVLPPENEDESVCRAANARLGRAASVVRDTGCAIGQVRDAAVIEELGRAYPTSVYAPYYLWFRHFGSEEARSSALRELRVRYKNHPTGDWFEYQRLLLAENVADWTVARCEALKGQWRALRQSTKSQAIRNGAMRHMDNLTDTAESIREERAAAGEAVH